MCILTLSYTYLYSSYISLHLKLDLFLSSLHVLSTVPQFTACAVHCLFSSLHVLSPVSSVHYMCCLLISKFTVCPVLLRSIYCMCYIMKICFLNFSLWWYFLYALKSKTSSSFSNPGSKCQAECVTGNTVSMQDPSQIPHQWLLLLLTQAGIVVSNTLTFAKSEVSELNCVWRAEGDKNNFHRSIESK